MEGWKIVSTRDGKETEADLYGVEPRIVRHRSTAMEILDKLRARAQCIEWEHDPPEYGVEPVNITGVVVSRNNQ